MDFFLLFVIVIIVVYALMLHHYNKPYVDGGQDPLDDFVLRYSDANILDEKKIAKL